jgi:hypothetical protein
MLPGSAQDTHGPWHGESQQTPSAQRPLAHSALDEHTPSLWTPQLLFVQDAFRHCALVSQVVKHWAFASSHAYGAQEKVAGRTHAPVASHLPGPVKEEPTHEGVEQTVPAGWPWQGPPSSHLPSRLPLGTGVQIPTLPGSAQDRHDPSHRELQHTPAAQKPLAHSTPVEHSAAGMWPPQLPFVQDAFEHCALVSQALKHRPFAWSHANGAHTKGAPAWQTPWPSQNDRSEPMAPSQR